MAQLVKNLSAVWETWDQSLGWEDSLEEGKATHSSVLAWRIPWAAKSWTRLSNFHRGSNDVNWNILIEFLIVFVFES